MLKVSSNKKFIQKINYIHIKINFPKKIIQFINDKITIFIHIYNFMISYKKFGVKIIT